MEPSLTERLCTRCALCCDGSLFADVELGGEAEANGLVVLGLEVEDDDAEGRVLSLPCGALRGKRCGIYAQRPKCCRTFECRLLQDVRRGAVSEGQAQRHIAEALSRIERIRALMVQLGHRDRRLPLKERCAEALARCSGPNPAGKRKAARLGAEMAAVEGLIHRVFLGENKGTTR